MAASSRKKDGFFDRLNTLLKSGDVFWDNEVIANRFVGVSMFYVAIAIGLICGANELGVFLIPVETMRSIALRSMPELLIPFGLCSYYHGEKKWLKFLMLIMYVIVFARIDSILTYNTPLLVVIPVVISVRYCSKRLTVTVASLTTSLFIFASWYGSVYGLLDANMTVLPPGTVLEIFSSSISDAIRESSAFDQAVQTRNVLIYSALPKLIMFSIIAIICVKIAERGYSLVIEQAEISKKESRIETELNLATDIQSNMLPRIFPPFPNRKEFDIYAIMDPAREVGGDLYDFYMIDDDHLVITVADVSGKGVPAALFMVTAKTLLKDQVYQGISAGGVFTKVNKILCEGNDAGLFVTCWLAIINVKTGETDFCNAGHNPPIVKHGSEGFDYLRTKPSLVLAAMDGYKYKSQHLVLEPGDVIYLYTDGVTEAVDKDNNQFGEDRLLNAVSADGELNSEDICKNIKKDVDDFAGDTEQFDDITMLALKYYGNTEA